MLCQARRRGRCAVVPTDPTAPTEASGGSKRWRERLPGRKCIFGATGSECIVKVWAPAARREECPAERSRRCPSPHRVTRGRQTVFRAHPVRRDAQPLLLSGEGSLLGFPRPKAKATRIPETADAVQGLLVQAPSCRRDGGWGT